jgi:hypothetical protein
MAMEGDRLVVGELGNPLTLPGGAAYVYERLGSSWIEMATLEPVDPVPAGEYGSCVAVSGDTIAVSSPRGDDGVPGRVLVFVGAGSTWTLQATLWASDGAGISDRFGTSLALEGDRLFVGAPQHEVGLGAVYAFERSGMTWNEVDKIVSPGKPTFGNSVALDGARLAIGAGDWYTGIEGMVYLYTETDGVWVAEAALASDEGSDHNNFASALDLRGDRLVVGAPWEDHAGDGAGAVYVYEHGADGWMESDRLYGDDTGTDDWFGMAVVITDAGEVAAATPAEFPLPFVFPPGKLYLFDEDPACPTAAFTGTPAIGVAPLSVAFQDLSTGATTGPTWDFGDGSSPVSGVGAIAHAYQSPGAFHVSMTVGNAFGIDRKVRPDYVKVYESGKAVVRNGTGVNPLCLLSTGLPIIATSWTCEIDASSHVDAFATYLAIYGNAVTGQWSAFGEVLVAPPLYGIATAPVLGGTSHYAILVPPDPQLLGLWVYTQGGFTDGEAVLCNGVDLQFGH